LRQRNPHVHLLALPRPPPRPRPHSRTRIFRLVGRIFDENAAARVLPYFSIHADDGSCRTVTAFPAGAIPSCMKTDALNRRLRFAPPHPAVKRVVLTEADYLIFEAINRHGPLPTHYLYEFTKHLRRNLPNLKWRLTQFYNGDRSGRFLTRPQQQFAGFEARYQHLVYDLAPGALYALAERGTLVRSSSKRTDPFLHQLMGACVAASIELSAKAMGLRYIPRDEILTNPKCPDATKLAPNPIAIPLSGLGEQKSLVPDDLFGIEYPSTGFRFFVVEIDRNTECIESRRIDQNSFGRKIAGYLDILRTQSFRSYWGIPNLHVLTITTNATHAANILTSIRRQAEANCANRFAVSYVPSFGSNWRVPRAVLIHLLEEPWPTTVGQKHLNRV
ncbi:MAG: hypothetical protein JWM33_3944, partial [Caulobacteraceae bacterium]|nr:hypothetical protein [Caulobacteraceae bacterium]